MAQLDATQFPQSVTSIYVKIWKLGSHVHKYYVIIITLWQTFVALLTELFWISTEKMPVGLKNYSQLSKQLRVFPLPIVEKTAGGQTAWFGFHNASTSVLDWDDYKRVAWKIGGTIFGEILFVTMWQLLTSAL